jgi:hypothetical protein
MPAKKQDEGITMADVSALNGGEAPQEQEQYVPSGDASAPLAARYADDDDGEPFVSEGMRHDLYQHGKAVDPNTGRLVVLA